MKISKPVNDLQKEFNALCEKGGGVKGGPARTKVQELLFQGSKKLNKFAYDEITDQLAKFADRDPWKVCFAVGLGWGHLAKIEDDFTDAATIALETLDGDALKLACNFHWERGPTPIEQSLIGGYSLFQKVRLPEKIPNELETIHQAQQRWLTPILAKDGSRPRYIGSWNSTAMFMVSLFAKPSLANTMERPEVLLPPGGPIHNGMMTLFKSHVLSKKPEGNELDDEAFQPGSIYLNNDLMVELRKGFTGWSLLDVHSGIYMLGTKHKLSNEWLS